MAHDIALRLSLPGRAQTVPADGKGAVEGGVRWILRAEGLALFAAAVPLYAHLGWNWGWFALLFLAPDLSFAAYLAGPRWGAAAYNAVHGEILPLALGALGLAMQADRLEALALIALAHVGLDRALGYGLKYASAFGDTHLGRLGHRPA